MNPRHYVPGPDEIKGDTSADEISRGNLSALYPEIKKDERPLIQNDAERHRRHDADLLRQIRGIRKSFFMIGLFIALPFILLGFAGTAYAQFGINNPQAQTLMVIPMLLMSLAIVAIWIACYHWIMARFRVHGLNGVSFILTALVFLSLTVVPLFYATWVTDNLWLHSLLFYPAFALTSVIITGAMLYVATYR